MICGGQRRALAFADMSKRTMRASDADRDRIVDRLNKAATEGRIAAEELEQRVSAALKARTYGELDDTVSDLPGPKAHRTPARRSGAAGWAVSVVRANPILLFFVIPVLAVTAAMLLAATIVWAVLAVVVLMLG